MVGVGSIGRNIALQLAQLGVGWIVMADPDTVSPVNLGTQGYRPSQINLPKVNACESDALAINPDCKVTTFECRMPSPDFRTDLWGDVVFLTTDTMSSRRAMILALQEQTESRRPKLVVDVRMLGEVFQVRCFVPTTSTLEVYMKDHIFDDSEALPGTCSTRTTGYGATCAASFAVASLAKFLRGKPVVPLIAVDLFTCDIDQSYPW